MAGVYLLCGYLLGCYSSTSLTQVHVTVVTDNAFTPSELEGITDGFRAWEAAVPELKISHRGQSHESLKGWQDMDWIYVYRADNSDDDGCVLGLLSKRSAAGLGTRWGNTGYICIDSLYVNTHQRRWKEVTMHELGHALGLKDHLPEPAVMAIPYDKIASEPQPADVDYFRRIWNSHEAGP